MGKKYSLKKKNIKKGGKRFSVKHNTFYLNREGKKVGKEAEGAHQYYKQTRSFKPHNGTGKEGNRRPSFLFKDDINRRSSIEKVTGKQSPVNRSENFGEFESRENISKKKQEGELFEAFKKMKTRKKERNQAVKAANALRNRREGSQGYKPQGFNNPNFNLEKQQLNVLERLHDRRLERDQFGNYKNPLTAANSLYGFDLWKKKRKGLIDEQDAKDIAFNKKFKKTLNTFMREKNLDDLEQIPEMVSEPTKEEKDVALDAFIKEYIEKAENADKALDVDVEEELNAVFNNAISKAQAEANKLISTKTWSNTGLGKKNSKGEAWDSEQLKRIQERRKEIFLASKSVAELQCQEIQKHQKRSVGGPHFACPPVGDPSRPFDCEYSFAKGCGKGCKGTKCPKTCEKCHDDEQGITEGQCYQGYCLDTSMGVYVGLGAAGKKKKGSKKKGSKKKGSKKKNGKGKRNPSKKKRK